MYVIGFKIQSQIYRGNLQADRSRDKPDAFASILKSRLSVFTNLHSLIIPVFSNIIRKCYICTVFIFLHLHILADF